MFASMGRLDDSLQRVREVSAGVLGVRTVHQTDAKAQLVVKTNEATSDVSAAESGDESDWLDAAAAGAAAGDDSGATSAHTHIALCPNEGLSELNPTSNIASRKRRASTWGLALLNPTSTRVVTSRRMVRLDRFLVALKDSASDGCRKRNLHCECPLPVQTPHTRS